jgi:hypothetical protein
MKTKPTQKNRFVSAITTLSMLGTLPGYAPNAQAKDFNKVCDSIIQRVKKNENLEGDMKASKCVEAKLADESRKWEINKAIIQSAAAATAATMYGIELWGKSQIATGMASTPVGTTLIDSGAAKVSRARQVCPKTALVAGIGVTGIDVFGNYRINETKKEYGQAAGPLFNASMITSLAIPMVGMMGKSGSISMPKLMSNKDVADTANAICTKAKPCTETFPEGYKEFDQAKLDEELDKKSGCLGTALLMGAMAALSYYEASNLEEAKNRAVKTAASVTSDAEKGNSFSISTNDVEDHKEVLTPANAAIREAESCNSAGGSNYLNCISRQSPETAAISNHPRFLNEIQKNVRNNLGDFAKAFNGKSSADAANYLGDALGIGAGPVSSFINSGVQAVKDAGGPGFLQESALPLASGYLRGSSGSRLGKTNGMDFDFNKLMSSMLGNLNGKASTEKKGSVAEAVFRRMDLLTPEAIQNNKDISLFARIAYRYRKKSDHLDPTLKSDVERTISSEKK